MKRKVIKRFRDIALFTVFNLLFINREANNGSEDLSKRIISINKRLTKEGFDYYLILDNDSLSNERYISLEEYNQLLDRQSKNNSTLFLHYYSK